MIDKWGYMKLKSFCTTKEIITRWKRQPTDWEKNLCQLYISQGINNQKIQGAQKIKTPRKTMTQMN
jgi:hypothetical protein